MVQSYIRTLVSFVQIIIDIKDNFTKYFDYIAVRLPQMNYRLSTIIDQLTTIFDQLSMINSQLSTGMTDLLILNIDQLLPINYYE